LLKINISFQRFVCFNLTVAPKENNKSTAKPTNSKDSEYSELLSNEILRLLYLIHLGDNIFYFCPNTGGIRVQKMGQKSLTYPKKPKQTKTFVSVHLLGSPTEYVLLSLSIGTTLDDVRRFICDEKNWKAGSKTASIKVEGKLDAEAPGVITPGRDKKVGFFGGLFGKASSDNDSDLFGPVVINEMTKSTNFYTELKKLLNLTRPTPEKKLQREKHNFSNSNNFNSKTPIYCLPINIVLKLNSLLILPLKSLLYYHTILLLLLTLIKKAAVVVQIGILISLRH